MWSVGDGVSGTALTEEVLCWTAGSWLCSDSIVTPTRFRSDSDPAPVWLCSGSDPAPAWLQSGSALAPA